MCGEVILDFLRGGYVYNLLNYPGANNYHWSSTALLATNAYALRFLVNDVGPSRNLSRCFGYPPPLRIQITSCEMDEYTIAYLTISVSLAITGPPQLILMRMLIIRELTIAMWTRLVVLLVS